MFGWLFGEPQRTLKGSITLTNDMVKEGKAQLQKVVKQVHCTLEITDTSRVDNLTTVVNWKVTGPADGVNLFRQVLKVHPAFNPPEPAKT